jgi:hypothetical protein
MEQTGQAYLFRREEHCKRLSALCRPGASCCQRARSDNRPLAGTPARGHRCNRMQRHGLVRADRALAGWIKSRGFLTLLIFRWAPHIIVKRFEVSASAALLRGGFMLIKPIVPAFLFAVGCILASSSQATVCGPGYAVCAGPYGQSCYQPGAGGSCTQGVACPPGYAACIGGGRPRCYNPGAGESCNASEPTRGRSRPHPWGSHRPWGEQR